MPCTELPRRHTQDEVFSAGEPHDPKPARIGQVTMTEANVTKTSPKGKNLKISKLAVATFAISLFVSMAASAQDEMVKGEVKKIDEATGKITLNHGPIKNLDMADENMTMVFRVQDPAMLKQVKVGDKVQFEAERATAGLTITKITKGK